MHMHLIRAIVLVTLLRSGGMAADEVCTIDAKQLESTFLALSAKEGADYGPFHPRPSSG